MLLTAIPFMGASGGAVPFDLSGSWEDDEEGWVMDGASVYNSPSQARTGSYLVSFDQDNTVDYLIENPGGLLITASVWFRDISGFGSGSDGGIKGQYKIGSGSFVDIPGMSTTAWSQSYQQIAGSFSSTPGQSATVRIISFVPSSIPFLGIDDWAISGT